ncbi:MAG: dihydrodipicolinate synthase family protein [Rikenellaceae bacterium]|nr:dihydrodipicolinate synthase family protein [Rikenellaceae bacterium]
MKKIQGIIPPMVTPLSDDDTIDREGTVKLVEHLIAGGVSGLFILGTTGEAQSLSYKCRYDFGKLVCRQVAGRVPVLVGITDTAMGESLHLAELARENGACGVVAAPPYYFAPSQRELVEYYTALADRVCLPLYLYNMPTHVKVSFDPQTVATLSLHPNIVGLKDSSSNMTYFQTVRHTIPQGPDFALYVGPEELTGEAVLMGADGGINGGANMFPELYVEMYRAASAGDMACVRRLQSRIMEISTSLYTIGQWGSSYLKGVKCALSLMGICSDHLSLPYRSFRRTERLKVRDALLRLQIPIAE